ncbi:MAG: DUF6165 family protein [Sphingomonas adhaesiva]|uniref:DUF6165 family protein n=1 Tax=Sphingomonas adhaesiva TaxID=28212 RepID=UPI002FF50D5E
MASLPSPSVPVSWGELLDKITILEIKRDRITRPDARANVLREHSLLARFGSGVLRNAAVRQLFGRLKTVNADLWDIEDAIRREEAAARFDDAFVRLARAVYHRNDERAALKRAINLALDSELIEEKSYADLTPARSAPPVAPPAPPAPAS